MEKLSKKGRYSLLIFCLVLLSNPNINVVDILPDFIAWLLLAKFFEKAADSAPYFEEARVGFTRLAMINLAKIPSFFIILFVKSHDTLDNNIFALFSFSFAVIELIFIIPAIRNIFEALFHLGERTDAKAFIAPIYAPICKKRSLTVQAIKEFTYFFAVCKTVIYVVPDMFLLTKITDRGSIVTTSKYYPYVLLISHVFGILIGAIWFLRIRNYTRRAYNEDKYDDALSMLADESSAIRYENRLKLRAINFALSLLCFSVILTIELSFSDWRNINLLPHFIYGFLLLASAHLLTKHEKKSALLYISGIIYCIASLISYIFSITFLSRYEYLDILENAKVREKYVGVEVSAVIEFVCLIVFLVFVAKAVNGFIKANTGISPDSNRYMKMEKEYHTALIKRNYILMSLGILAGAAKCIHVFINSDVQTFFTESSMIATSSLPWFNIIVTLTSLLYIAFCLYFSSTLKEEAKIKYSA